MGPSQPHAVRAGWLLRACGVAYGGVATAGWQGLNRRCNQRFWFGIRSNSFVEPLTCFAMRATPAVKYTWEALHDGAGGPCGRWTITAGCQGQKGEAIEW